MSTHFLTCLNHAIKLQHHSFRTPSPQAYRKLRSITLPTVTRATISPCNPSIEAGSATTPSSTARTTTEYLLPIQLPIPPNYQEGTSTPHSFPLRIPTTLSSPSPIPYIPAHPQAPGQTPAEKINRWRLLVTAAYPPKSISPRRT